MKKAKSTGILHHPGTPATGDSQMSQSIGTPITNSYPSLITSSPMTDSEDTIQHIERERQVYRWVKTTVWKPAMKDILPNIIHFPESYIKPQSQSQAHPLFFKLKDQNSMLPEDTLCFQTSVVCAGKHAKALHKNILNMDFMDYYSPFRSYQVLRDIGQDIELLRIEMSDDSYGHCSDVSESPRSELLVRRSSRGWTTVP